ncbi:putative proline hydroxylase [Methylophilaceae bacterium 11]|nr:putative proline hydroxylase [Methylophilaceae bacterium 11]
MHVGANPACYNFAMQTKILSTTDDDKIVTTLAEQGYVVIDDYLPAHTILALAEVARTKLSNQEMAHARTGKQAETRQHIRGDHICWLDENSPDIAIQQYFVHMQHLRQLINQQLYMGLASLETHLAIYPVGAVYQKHLDQFNVGGSAQLNTRKISSILYLNQDWQPKHGGELRLHLDNEEWIDILPIGGRLVLFLSADFWHEVLPAYRERLSLTGWFRTREPQLL